MHIMVHYKIIKCIWCIFWYALGKKRRFMLCNVWFCGERASQWRPNSHLEPIWTSWWSSRIYSCCSSQILAPFPFSRAYSPWFCDAHNVPSRLRPPRYEDFCHVCACRLRAPFSTVVKPSEKLGWEYLGTFQICLNSLQTMIKTMEMYSFRTDWSWPIEDSTTRTQATSWSKTWGMPRHEVPRREIGYFIRHRTVSYTQRHSFFAFSFLVTMFSDLF